MSASREELKHEVNTSLQDIIKLLRQFAELQDIKDYINDLIAKLQDLYALNDQELESLSAQLAENVSDARFTGIKLDNISLSEVLLRTHAAFESEKPRNTIDPITVQPIAAENRFITSDRYQFDIEALVHWLNVKTDSMQNPCTRVKFSLADQEALAECARTKNLTIVPRTITGPQIPDDPAMLAGALNQLAEEYQREYFQQHGPDLAYFAASRGDPHIIEILARFGVSLNMRFRGGTTPAHVAAHHGHVAVIVALKNVGANLDTPTSDGITPAYIAAQNGHAEVITVLKNYGANLNTPMSDGTTPAIIAAQNGHVEAIIALKNAGANLNTPNSHGATPAIIAAQNGHAEVITALKKAGVNLNIPSSNGITLAYIAAQNGHAEVITALKKAGANLDTPRFDGATPAIIAAQRGHAEVITALKNAGVNLDTPRSKGATLAFIAAQRGHAEVITALNDAGVNLDTPRSNGATPAIIAAQNGHAKVITALKNVGVNLNIPSSNGITLAYIAAQNGHAEVITALKKAGANLDTPRFDGATPAIIAAQQGHAEVITALNDAGVNLDTPRSNGATLAFIAAQRGHAEVITALKNAGVNLDTPSPDGATPAIIAVQKGHAEVIVALKNAGANLDTPTPKGITHIAAQMGHLKAITTLTDVGANLNVSVPATKVTPLVTAVLNGHTEVVKFLLNQQILLKSCSTSILGTEFQQFKSQNTTIMPYEIATILGHTDICNAFKYRLINAVKSRNEALALFLLEHNQNSGFVINQKDENGMTVLHYACALGMPNLVLPLLAAGADITLENNQKRQPLDCTVMTDDDIAKRLGDSTTELSERDSIRSGQTEVIKLLIDQGVDYSRLIRFFSANNDERLAKLLAQPTIAQFINCAGMPSGKTALHQAAAKGHLDVCKKLIVAGASIDATDVEGNTPIMLAALAKKAEAVLLLAQRGANIEIKNQEGKVVCKLLNETNQGNLIASLLEITTQQNRDGSLDSAADKTMVRRS